MNIFNHSYVGPIRTRQNFEKFQRDPYLQLKNILRTSGCDSQYNINVKDVDR